MKAVFTVLVLVALVLATLLLTACGAEPAATPDTFESPPGLPNPASQFCEDQGNKVEIRTAADGSQTGYCLFPDGSECEEWAFYRGECGPGTPKP
jgi:inhibitor of cysteine peptidase